MKDESAFDNLRDQYGAYFADVPTPPDLRTADQRHTDDIAALAARVAKLETIVAKLVAVLEVRL